MRPPTMTILAIGAIKPQTTLAVSAAKCPFKAEFIQNLSHEGL